jgi:hypothetical protein
MSKNDNEKVAQHAKENYCNNVEGSTYNTPEGEKFKRICRDYKNVRGQQEKISNKADYDTIVKSKKSIIAYIEKEEPLVDIWITGGTDDDKIELSLYELKKIILTQLRHLLTPCIVRYTTAKINTDEGKRGFEEKEIEEMISLCKKKEHHLDIMVHAFSLGCQGNVSIKSEYHMDMLGQDCITDYLTYKQWGEEAKNNDYKNIPHVSLGGHDCLQPCKRRREVWPPHPEWGKNVCACPVQKWSLWKGTYNTVDKCPENQC